MAWPNCAVSFEVRLASRVANTIRRLKPRVADEVLAGIERAAQQTHQHVRVPVGPCAGRPCFWFKVAMPPMVLNVACVFLYEQDESAIYVIAIGMLGTDGVPGLPGGVFK